MTGWLRALLRRPERDPLAEAAAERERAEAAAARCRIRYLADDRSARPSGRATPRS